MTSLHPHRLPYFLMVECVFNQLSKRTAVLQTLIDAQVV